MTGRDPGRSYRIWVMRSFGWLGFWRIAWRSYRWVWQAARRQFVVTLIADLAAAIALAVLLLCGRSLAGQLTGGEGLETVGQVTPEMACIAGALFVAGLSVVVQREARLVVSEQVLRHLQAEIIDIAGSVDYERFEEQDFHDLLDRASGHGANRAMQMAYDLIGLVNSVVASSALLVVLASSTPEILPALVLIAVPFVLAARLSARMAFRLAYELTPEDRLRSALFWTLAGRGAAKEVRVFDLQRPLRDRWSSLFEGRIARMESVARRRSILNGVASLASSALVAVLLVVIVSAAIDQRVSLADGAIAIVALQQLSVRIRTTANATGSLRESALFLDDFEHFRSLRQRPDDEPGGEPLPPASTLRVEAVRFRYPGTDRFVLEDIALEIRAGEIVALVGVSGSGKSTLAHLVAGLYRPTEGRITWDGVDIDSIPRASYWRSVGVVYQDYFEYSLTARENIAISDHRRASDGAAVEAAARRAGVHEAIMRLPGRYDCMLSRAFEGGADLSEGEWQRVAVARAFFRDAPLLILDEPASALDALAERQLYEGLADLSANRSVLLISHRFSTVRLADRIYVLQDGRVTECGTHGDLLALDGHYANMFRIQASGFVELT